MQLQINLPGYEALKVEINNEGEIAAYQLECSSITLELFKKCIDHFGLKLNSWDLSQIKIEGQNKLELRRSEYLLQELILKAKGTWELPFSGQIVCNCREVYSETIDQALVAGAQTIEDITYWTTACSSCTSCKSKIEDLIRFRSS